jgi:hypothetical protein
MQKGDKVCLILGAKVPFVLRTEGMGYKLISEAYCHGIMNGEGEKDLPNGAIVDLKIV